MKFVSTCDVHFSDCWALVDSLIKVLEVGAVKRRTGSALLLCHKFQSVRNDFLNFQPAINMSFLLPASRHKASQIKVHSAWFQIKVTLRVSTKTLLL